MEALQCRLGTVMTSVAVGGCLTSRRRLEILEVIRGRGTLSTEVIDVDLDRIGVEFRMIEGMLVRSGLAPLFLGIGRRLWRSRILSLSDRNLVLI